MTFVWNKALRCTPGILYPAAVSGGTSTVKRTDLPELQASDFAVTVAVDQMGSGPQPMKRTWGATTGAQLGRWGEAAEEVAVG